ncbi:MAG TPA: ATP-binding protein [Polyangiaceae bacterium]|nr:ATP-binding protein [Polyangiaceae bacterium]
MTLAQRLLVAIGVLTVVTTLALGLGVREAWRDAEERRFQSQFEGAVARLESELGHDVHELPALVEPLCDHDPSFDSAMVSLRAGALDAGQRLQLSLHAKDLLKAYRLDELVLVTGRGEVLGGGQVGTVDPKLAAELKKSSGEARVRTEDGKVAIVAHCSRASGGVTLGIIGARSFATVLERVGASQGLTLSLEPPTNAKKAIVDSMRLPQLAGITIFASLSRVPLLAAIVQLEQAVLVLGIACFAGALVLAWLLSRGLAEPIVSLAEQARRVVTGEPVAIRGRGGRELEQLADSFNHAIADLAALRKRLAATERIAARREIARQVAHEIKNPLAPIRAAVETLRRLRARNDPAFDEYFDEATRTVLGEVARIASIVQEFTRFARLPAPDPAPMDFERTVRDVVALHAAGEAPVELVARPIPEIVADRDQMVQVVTNLVQNALDAVATRPGGKVVVTLSPLESARVALSVRDNGPGLSPEMRERLFEPYATTKPHGTGLGLAIAERIVVEHGGGIAYRDADGGGAEFLVEIPVAGPPLLPEGPPPSSPEGASTPGPAGKTTSP